jgi:hypothetical protein
MKVKKFQEGGYMDYPGDIMADQAYVPDYPETIGTDEYEDYVPAEAYAKTSTLGAGRGGRKAIGDGAAMTGADWADLAALLGDTAALGVSFIPGVGNIASAGVGALSSLTNFGSDVARDGLDWGDVGTLAANLGLDAITLLPAIGGGAKVYKIAKFLKQTPVIAKAVGLIGGTFAGGMGVVKAYDKIQNGNWTFDDIRTVVNGLRGLKGAYQSGAALSKDVRDFRDFRSMHKYNNDLNQMYVDPEAKVIYDPEAP